MNKSAFFIIAIFLSITSYSQNKPLNKLKIFLDCNSCDITFIKQNLNSVEFVRDQNFADIHLFFTRQTNGSGGREYVIDFIGQNEFNEINDQLSFSTNTNMSNDDIRNRTLNFIKYGLVRYWVKRGDTNHLSVNIENPESGDENSEEIDSWDSWVFRLGVNGWFNGEETSKRSNVNFNAQAKRVTEKNKFSFRLGFQESKSTYSFEGEDIISINGSKYLNINDIISITNHWSAGVFGSMGNSIYSNKDFYWSLKPAIEYNFFEYSKSAKKQLTLSYRNGTVFNKYIERSVYGKNKEHLWEHELTFGGSVNQKWGNIYGEASFDQYLHDTTLNSLSFYLGTSIRLFKGFNLNISGNYSVIRNQINIPVGNVSLEELLLQQQQQESGYDYWFSIGFSYSFGSIYNSIVNPRFNF